MLPQSEICQSLHSSWPQRLTHVMFQCLIIPNIQSAQVCIWHLNINDRFCVYHCIPYYTVMCQERNFHSYKVKLYSLEMFHGWLCHVAMWKSRLVYVCRYMLENVHKLLKICESFPLNGLLYMVCSCCARAVITKQTLCLNIRLYGRTYYVYLQVYT